MGRLVKLAGACFRYTEEDRDSKRSEYQEVSPQVRRREFGHQGVITVCVRRVQSSIGLDGDLGTIESGKRADGVVIEGNPLDDIQNTKKVRYVMKNGRLYDGETLNERWPRERSVGELTWQAE